MSRITLKPALSFLAAALLAACGSGDATGPDIPTPPAASAKVSLTNNSNTQIIEVNISSCTDLEWGANRLNAGEVIEPGATRTWTVSSGCYDFRAMTATKAGTWRNRTVSPGATINLALSSAANVVIGVTGPRNFKN